jgi:hypothetical protein
MDLKYFIGFFFNPIILSGILGLFLGLSGIRDIIFQKIITLAMLNKD